MKLFLTSIIIYTCLTINLNAKNVYSFGCLCSNELMNAYMEIDSTLESAINGITPEAKNLNSAIKSSIKTAQMNLDVVKKSNSILLQEVVELEALNKEIADLKEIETRKKGNLLKVEK